MRTVQMTLDETLVQEIDQVVKELGTTRSAFAREALRAIAQVRRQRPWSVGIGKAMHASRYSQANSATGKTSRSGASDATREVRLYTFARPDKRRPVVILTRDTVLEYGEVTVAPVTSVIRDIPSEVLLSPFDGMPREWAIDLDHIQTVARGKVGRTHHDAIPSKNGAATSGPPVCPRL